ncbi:MAG: hypothetical protein ACR2PZ_24325 [Pseudomonadales bacterium]
MSAADHHDTEASQEASYAAEDSRADAIAIGIMFVTLVLFAVHFASGWTFDI